MRTSVRELHRDVGAAAQRSRLTRDDVEIGKIGIAGEGDAFAHREAAFERPAPWCCESCTCSLRKPSSPLRPVDFLEGDDIGIERLAYSSPVSNRFAAVVDILRHAAFSAGPRHAVGEPAMFHVPIRIVPACCAETGGARRTPTIAVRRRWPRRRMIVFPFASGIQFMR